MKFAVYITTYQKPNGESIPLVMRALKSIENQTYKNYSLYVICDAYSDQAQIEYIKAEVESKKGYFFNIKESYGLTHYRNDLKKRWSTGGLNATTHAIEKILSDGLDWVCKLDHDDIWKPNHLQVMYERLSKANNDVVFAISRGKFGKKILPVEKYAINDYHLNRGAFFHSSTCINFSKIKLRYEDPFKKGANMPGDAWLWIRLKKYLKANSFRAVYIPIITLIRDSEGSILQEK